MEKSGRIRLTYDELKRLNAGEELPGIMSQWGFATMAELKEVIEAGQYEVVEVNL